MFERFTDRARRVLVVAQDEARNLSHGFIEPEHLLLGLLQGDGLAAMALGELGVSVEAVRDKVAGRLASGETHTRASKVPFSPGAKKALEMSLREALTLGHNYIGTEHLALGVLRVASDGGLIPELLGVDADEVRARVLEIMPKGTASASRQSPAAVDALQRARQLAGSGPMTTGHVLLALLADGACQATMALSALGATTESLRAQLGRIPIAGTSDAPPRPRSVEIKLGQLTTTIDDPDLAAALGSLTAAELATALREAFSTAPEPEAPEGPDETGTSSDSG